VKPAPRSRGSRAKRPSQTKRPSNQAAGPSGAAARAALARVRRACLALPDTTEKIAWGSPTFRVKERLFVMFMDNHHGDGRLAIWCHAAPGAQEAFVASDPDGYYVPPYVGPSGWIGVRLDRSLGASEIGARIRAAHESAAEAGAAQREKRRRR